MSDLQPLKDWCKANHVHYQHARRLAIAKLFPVVRIGRRLFVSADAVRDWIRAGGSPLPGGWRREPKAGGAA